MDLRCRLEHNERDWSREKAELLERFNVERREWESQLKDMQGKIEEVSVLNVCILMRKLPNLKDPEALGKRTQSVKARTLWIQLSWKLFLMIHLDVECQRKMCLKKLKTKFMQVLKTVHCGQSRQYTESNSSYFVCFFFCASQALKEIARVSEELCSYQDEIRKKSGDKSQIYDDLRALERENWIALTPDNTCQANGGSSKSWRETTPDPDSYREIQTSTGELSDIDNAAPPIPPRVSSRNLSTPIHFDTELHIPESPVTTVKRCHSPCVLVDRKCHSPSIVRKFEAMLQENEGKVLIDGVVASCSVPVNSNCNMGCCHNRWSCDASKFTSSKLSANGTVQKSFSEVSILAAGKRSDYSPGVGNLKELQTPLIVKDLPVDLLLSSLEISPACLNQHVSKRNIMLEQKTAEFNRTLFQAEMGRAAEEQDGFTVTDVCSAGCTPVFSATSASCEALPPRDTTFQQKSNDVATSVITRVSLQQSAENKQRQMTEPGHQAQPKHVSAPVYQSDSSRPGARLMNDHPWKPLTLAAYPRPEGSRSNYGAVERILKNYESAAKEKQNQSQQDLKSSSPNVSNGVIILNVNPFVSPQEDKEPSVSSNSIQKNFSRPARPANRRLPSRWANCSPTSSGSSSPSTIPVVPPSFPIHKHTSSFAYSNSFHIEAVII
uniref:MTCL family member 3a n=1 Tax=Labrus bergylta TaxID=56723 RepID=A0A3Q3ES11_9LABR